MATIGRLNVILGLNSALFNTGMAQAGTRVHAFRGQVTGTTGKLSSLAGAMSKVAIAAAAMYVAISAVKPAEAFNQALSSSTAIMGELSQAMRQDMAQAAKDVATTTKFSAAETAGAYYFLASAGLDAAQSIKALPAVAKFAQAGMFSLAEATSLSTDALSALGMKSSDPETNLANLIRVTDALTSANTLADASTLQFSEALTTKAGAALRVLGKDIEEGIGMLAAFADQGVKGAEAGTQMAIVLRELQAKSILNAAAFKEHSIAVYDDTGDMRNFADIIKDLEVELSGMSDKMKKATLMQLGFSEKSINSLQVLIGMSDKMREAEAATRGLGGITEEVAGKQLPIFTKGWEKMKTLFERLGIVIFTPVLAALGGLMLALAPIIELVTMTLEAMSNAFSKFFGITLENIWSTAEWLGWVDKAAPKNANLAKAVNNATGELIDMNATAASTPAVLDAATSAVERFIKSMQDDIRFEGLDGPARELERMWADGAFTITQATERFTDAMGNYADKTIDVIDFDSFVRARDAMEELLDMQRQQEEFARKTQEHNSIMGQGRNLTQSLETPMEGFKRRIADANNLVEKGAIGWETYTREISAARNELMELQMQTKGASLIEKGSQADFSANITAKMRAELLRAIPDVPMPNMGPGPASMRKPALAPRASAGMEPVRQYRQLDRATSFDEKPQKELADLLREMISKTEDTNEKIEMIAVESAATSDNTGRTAASVEKVTPVEVVQM